MGRYVHGTCGFSYKYVYASQPTNLTSLAEWSGIAQPRTSFSLSTQFFAPFSAERESTTALVDGVGHLTCVYQSAVPPFDLVDDVESAIYQVCDRWQQVVREVDAWLPGPALRPDIAGGQSFAFTRDDWTRLAERIGHGADPSDRTSLEAARRAAFESGADEFLPYMAACALHHAVAHDLARFAMVDAQPRETNLWSVADDYAGALDDAASWEERAAHARLLTFQFRHDLARPHLARCVDERPTELFAARGLLAGWVWDDNWAEVGTLADKMLGVAQPDDATHGELLLWRGEAAWTLGEMDSARADAQAAADLGRRELLDALDQAAASE